MDLESTYARLPIWLQNAACAAEGLRVRRLRLAGAFPHLLRESRDRSAWSAEQFAAYRDERLRRFVCHCASSVPYYRNIFRELGAHPGDFRTLHDLNGLPVLSRAEVQSHLSDLCSEAVLPATCSVAHTSGTTGGGLTFRVTQNAVREQWAVWWRYRIWHGLDLDTWCGSFGGRLVVPITQRRPPYWRFNIPGHQVLFSGHHLSRNTLPAYAAELRRLRLPWLHGYPSLLALVAGYLLDTGDGLDYQPRWISTGAENLLDHQRDLIERAFGVRPIQHYGLAELAANLSECPLGSLHVDEDFAAIEFLDSDLDGSCRVVGTSFANVATALLRYEIGDAATLMAGSCACGRPGRLVRRIDGRHEDYVVLADGTRIGRLDHAFKDLVHIREAQIVQRRIGAILVRVVRGPSYDETDEHQLRAQLEKRLGADTQIAVEYVEHLKRSSAGKLRLVLSELREGGLNTVGAGV